jgi:hypothetical protein
MLAARQPATPAASEAAPQPSVATSEEAPKDDPAEAPVDGELTDELTEEAPETALTDGSVAFKLEDGTPVTVEEARKGYLRQQDWTQSKQHVAELTKATNERQSIVDKAAEFYASRLPILQERLKSTIPPEPSQELRNRDAAAYWDQYNMRELHLRELANAEAELANVAKANAEIREMRAREFFIAESQKLLEKVPSWKDQKIADKERNIIANYGRSIGFTDAELSAIDHRGIIVLRDAALGAKVRANNAKAAVTKNNPTVSAGNTAGINGSATTKTPALASRPAPVAIDPNASSRSRFQQGAALLAARPRARTN